MPKSSVPKPVQNLSYEEALAELEGIVAALEGEQNPLEESLKLFERGQALVARCGELLEAAELKVKQMSGESVLPFEEEST
jgi:exodeoxyribonuclease VII small subunit